MASLREGLPWFRCCRRQAARLVSRWNRFAVSFFESGGGFPTLLPLLWTGHRWASWLFQSLCLVSVLLLGMQGWAHWGIQRSFFRFFCVLETAPQGGFLWIVIRYPIHSFTFLLFQIPKCGLLAPKNNNRKPPCDIVCSLDHAAAKYLAFVTGAVNKMHSDATASLVRTRPLRFTVSQFSILCARNGPRRPM